MAVTNSKSNEKNFITPAGFKRLVDELHSLRFEIRPEVTKTVAWAASNGDRSENGDYIYGKKRLREIDKKIEQLGKKIDAAEVIDPLLSAKDYVAFGAKVLLRDEQEREVGYVIVGVDECDPSRGRISWRSPLGAALIRAKAKEGDLVTFQSPRGEQEMEVLVVRYEKVE